MMPLGHIACTWAVARLSPNANVDYRLLAVAALLPDMVDKPLALTLLKSAKSSQLAAHSLISNGLLVLLIAFIRPKMWPYTLASVGHLLIDRMWQHPRTFLWPFYGWRSFRIYKTMNTPKKMVEVYLGIIRTPMLSVPEVIATVFFTILAYRHELWQGEKLISFLKSGQFPTKTF